MADSPYRILIKPQVLNWIVLGVIMLGTTLFLVHVSNRAIAEIDALSNEPVFLGRHELLENKIDTPNSSASLTASWKRYRNEKYGFEVRYPSDFTMRESREEYYGGVTIPEVTFSRICENIGCFDYEPTINIYIYEDQNIDDVFEPSRIFSVGNFKAAIAKSKITGQESMFIDNGKRLFEFGVKEQYVFDEAKHLRDIIFNTFR